MIRWIILAKEPDCRAGVVLPDASIRAESWYFSQKTVTVQGGYGVVFANPGTSFVEAGRVAVQV